MSGGKCEVAQKRRACLVAFYPSLGLGRVFFFVFSLALVFEFEADLPACMC